MSPDRDERNAYNRVSAGRAFSAETWSGSLYDEVAFIHRYGTSAELEQRYREVCQIAEWWALRGPFVTPEDSDAIDGLELARERLHWLWVTAETVERDLRDRGWAYEPSRRGKSGSCWLTVESRRPGPRRSLTSELVADLYDRLTATEGWSVGNSEGIRAEIRARLRDTLPPEDITDTKVKSAINSILNPDRH